MLYIIYIILFYDIIWYRGKASCKRKRKSKTIVLLTTKLKYNIYLLRSFLGIFSHFDHLTAFFWLAFFSISLSLNTLMTSKCMKRFGQTFSKWTLLSTGAPNLLRMSLNSFSSFLIQGRRSSCIWYGVTWTWTLIPVLDALLIDL